MQKDHDIKILNSLIETTLDSADGYAEAAKDARSESLISLFRERSTERRQVASTLQQRVRLLGGDPKDDGTVLASAHRMFVNLRTAVYGTLPFSIAALRSGSSASARKIRSRSWSSLGRRPRNLSAYSSNVASEWRSQMRAS